MKKHFFLLPRPWERETPYGKFLNKSALLRE